MNDVPFHSIYTRATALLDDLKKRILEISNYVILFSTIDARITDLR